MKKILLFTTGGTIASKEGNNGLEPEMDANELLSYMGDLANRYDITCRELLSLDSSNIQAEEWRKIARNIFENLEQYDGIGLLFCCKHLSIFNAEILYRKKGRTT